MHVSNIRVGDYLVSHVNTYIIKESKYIVVFIADKRYRILKIHEASMCKMLFVESEIGLFQRTFNLNNTVIDYYFTTLADERVRKIESLL